MLKEKKEQRKCFPTAWGKLITEEEAYRQLNRQIAAMTANLFQVMRIFEPSWEKRTEAICDIANMMNMAVETAAKRMAELTGQIQDSLRSTFRPEFLNRIDDVITFNALSIEAMEPIVKLQLNDVRKRLADRRGTLDVSAAALEHLAIDGFDPVYGARPLQRLIQREVVDRIAQKIVEGKLPDRSHVLIDIDEATDEYVCRVEPPLELDAVPVD